MIGHLSLMAASRKVKIAAANIEGYAACCRIDHHQPKIARLLEGEAAQLRTALSILNQEPQTKLVVYAVCFANYFPAEIDSLWLDPVEAQKRVDELVAAEVGGFAADWGFEPMTVNEEWRLDVQG